MRAKDNYRKGGIQLCNQPAQAHSGAMLLSEAQEAILPHVRSADFSREREKDFPISFGMEPQ